MIKHLYIAPLLYILLHSSVGMSAMNCPENGGYEFTENSKTYCQSTGAYKNYWSAETWCDAVGGKLVNTYTECGTSTPTLYTNGVCKFISDYATTDGGKTPYPWTSTVYIKGSANYRVGLSAGNVKHYYRNDQYSANVALCVE